MIDFAVIALVEYKFGLDTYIVFTLPTAFYISFDSILSQHQSASQPSHLGAWLQTFLHLHGKVNFD